MKDKENRASGEYITNVSEILEKNLSQKVADAYNLATFAHREQKRLSGEPYISHLEETTNIILGWLRVKEITPYIEDLLASSLLHDAAEDTKVGLEDIQSHFGNDVAQLVKGVSKLKTDHSDTDLELLQNVAETGYTDARVFVIKLADRTHNMKTLEFMPPNKQLEKAQETMDVYVPLAESMGIWEAKRDLEDLSFSYLHPEFYQTVKSQIDTDPRLSEEFQSQITSKLLQTLGKTGIDFKIDQTRNSLWQIYQKREKAADAGKSSQDDFKYINDVISFRIIADTDNSVNLYVLQGTFDLDPEFKDKIDTSRNDNFLVSPQENGYQSLQSTINLPEGSVELSFATSQMEDFNRYGVISYMRSGKMAEIENYKRKIAFDSHNKASFFSVDSTYLDFLIQRGYDPNIYSVMIEDQVVDPREPIRNGVQIFIRHISDMKHLPMQTIFENSTAKTHKILDESINRESTEYLTKLGKQKIEEALKTAGFMSMSDVPDEYKQKLLYEFDGDIDSLQTLYRRIGSGFITIDRIKNIFQDIGLSKDLGFSTISISGKNTTGVLQQAAGIITSFNINITQVHLKGNVVHEGDNYTLRFVINNADQDHLAAICSRFFDAPYVNDLEWC